MTNRTKRKREAIKTARANRTPVGAGIEKAPQRNGSRHGRFERHGAAWYAEGNKQNLTRGGLSNCRREASGGNRKAR
jgi:hypothetical protein